MARENNGRTVALVGGAGVLAWLLLRGGAGTGRGAAGTGGRLATGRRCVVWIRANAIEVDGVAADLPTVVARCRVAGAAEVHATGAAITRVVGNVLEALHAAGITLYTPPDLAYIVPSEPLR